MRAIPAHDLLRLCHLRAARGLVLHRPPPRAVLHPTLSGAPALPPPSPPLIFYFPAADALSRARTRRTKADTDKRRWASRSADRRTARSRRCTSSQRTTHVRPRRACTLLSGARRCAGCYIRRNRLAAALRGARINLRMRMLAMGSGVGLRLRYAPVPSPYLSSSPLLSLVCGAH